ncbi:hypothetical protein [Neptunicella marina]|uniref:Uncharacterized protein n=1 Tax=Neptunicella marina TaxID=2125989 RepID=A0A8J6IXY7_9ALTE|nr:hypothetical protein [Neptunicella marina]MBC3767460.1 hypothetical protein [Neptunicella marina]
MTLHFVFEQWLSELESELNLVEASDINEEANGNLFTFAILTLDPTPLNTEQIEDFISKCLHIYQAKNTGLAKVFYCWLDEQAGQIRTSAISASHNKLPFRCNLKSCSSSELAYSIKSNESGLFSCRQLNVWQHVI